MGWIARFIRGAHRNRRNGLRLPEGSLHWHVGGPRTFSALFRALDGWLPDDAILCFEAGHPDAEIKSFMAQFAIPERGQVALGTLWPSANAFHVPAKGVMAQLAELMERHAEPELAVHFHVYRSEDLLLEWYDAFSEDPLRINGSIPEEQVRTLAAALGTPFIRKSR